MTNPIQLFGDDQIAVWWADSRDLSFVESESVQLCITSPPYNAGKSYDTHHDLLSEKEYWDLIQAVFSEVYRTILPGGRLALNVPMWSWKRELGFIPLAFMPRITELGFTFKDWITWVKNNLESPDEGGSMAWGAYPTTPSILSCSEVILIFRKGEAKTSRENRDITMAEWVRWTKGVWVMQGAQSKTHPATFPELLPSRLMKLYSGRGELVLDPFVGEGTTLAAARKLGRRGIGVDISRNYAEHSVLRVSQPVLLHEEIIDTDLEQIALQIDRN